MAAALTAAGAATALTIAFGAAAAEDDATIAEAVPVGPSYSVYLLNLASCWAMSDWTAGMTSCSPRTRGRIKEYASNFITTSLQLIRKECGDRQVN